MCLLPGAYIKDSEEKDFFGGRGSRQGAEAQRTRREERRGKREEIKIVNSNKK